MLTFGLIIGLFVLVFAYWLYKMGSDILDIDEHFMAAVWAFMGLFVAAAIALYFIIPTPGRNSSVSGLANAWVHPDVQTDDHLPLYH